MQGTTPLLLTPKAEAPKPPPNIDGSVPTQTYRIEVGHEQGVLPGNIVGCIANEAGVEGRNIGHIDIRDDHSYVDLPGLPDEVLGQMQKVKIRGTELRMKRVESKPDKPKFSGKSRRPDRVGEEFSERRPPKARSYEGTPRFSDSDKPRFNAGEKPRFAAGDKPRFAAGDKPRFARDDSPRPAGKPPFKAGFKKPFKKPFKKSFTKPGGRKGD
jgi:ATP-dependent RNA helicase DeaD